MKCYRITSLLLWCHEWFLGYGQWITSLLIILWYLGNSGIFIFQQCEAAIIILIASKYWRIG